MDTYTTIGIVLGAVIFGLILIVGIVVGRKEHA
jgi:hypothetical protein